MKPHLNIPRIAALLCLATALVLPATPAGAKKRKPKPPARVLTVYYFHGTARCVSCRTIEALSEEAIKTGFPKELASGRIVWKVVDVDLEENRHFIDDYTLYTKSVVVVETHKGKQLRWKNLDRVWKLLKDRKAFIKYVQDDVRAWLEKPADG